MTRAEHIESMGAQIDEALVRPSQRRMIVTHPVRVGYELKRARYHIQAASHCARGLELLLQHGADPRDCMKLTSDLGFYADRLREISSRLYPVYYARLKRKEAKA